MKYTEKILGTNFVYSESLFNDKRINSLVENNFYHKYFLALVKKQLHIVSYIYDINICVYIMYNKAFIFINTEQIFPYFFIKRLKNNSFKRI